MTNSSIVNVAILCSLLSSGGNPTCVTPSNPISEIKREVPLTTEFAQAEKAGSARRVFVAPGRLDVHPPSRPLKLAEENEVSLQSHQPGLNSVEIQQVQYSPGDTGPHKTPHFPKGGWATLPVLHRADGSAYVNVVPRALGQVVLEIKARFPDGGETHTEALISVDPPDRSPEKFIVGEDRGDLVIPLYLKPYPTVSVPHIQAIYGSEGDAYQINPAFVSFKIRTANDAHIVELNKTTGLIRPVRPGQALLKTTFQGWSNLTCIVVEDKFNPSPVPRPPCESLLLPGEKLATPTRSGNSRY